MGCHADPTANQALGEINREWNRMARLAERIRKAADTAWAERESRRFVGIYKRLLEEAGEGKK